MAAQGFDDECDSGRRRYLLTLARDQHHAEACFALHHASVSISSLFERNCLDPRADIL
jgi:hypothetical protein